MNDLTYISILADEKRKVKNIFSCKNPLKLKAFWKMNKNLKFFNKKLILYDIIKENEYKIWRSIIMPRIVARGIKKEDLKKSAQSFLTLLQKLSIALAALLHLT